MKAIVAKNLAKQYNLGGREGYRTLRQTIGDFVRAPGRTVRSLRAPKETFWALNDVSFEIGQGEIVGIIGRNGAGKSTLLKLLSRVTEPTKGFADIYGRMASLLEVGTGFHPELTGRENTFFNGVILGMRRAEVERKLDEIVAFAGVEKFIDTPVKHYSSGMYLRLAFSVAAHLEPDIMVVDEVLAVGDAAFQQKCLNKMDDVGKGGHTVLFVSHNMPAITRLCPRTILLDQGKVVEDGPSHKVVGTYLRGTGTMAERTWEDPAKAPQNEIVRIRAVRARDASGNVVEVFDVRRPVCIELDYDVLQGGHVLSPNFHVFNEDGTCAFALIDTDPKFRRTAKGVGSYRTVAEIPGNLLSEGSLIVGAAVSTMSTSTLHVYERDAIALQVVDPAEGDSARADFVGPMPGVVRPLVSWDTEPL